MTLFRREGTTGNCVVRPEKLGNVAMSGIRDYADRFAIRRIAFASICRRPAPVDEPSPRKGFLFARGDKCEANALRVETHVFCRFRRKTAPDRICRRAPIPADTVSLYSPRARVDDKSGRVPVCVRLCRLRITPSQTLQHYPKVKRRVSRRFGCSRATLV